MNQSISYAIIGNKLNQLERVLDELEKGRKKTIQEFRDIRSIAMVQGVDLPALMAQRPTLQRKLRAVMILPKQGVDW